MANASAKVFAPVDLGTLADARQARVTVTLAQIQALGANNTGSVSLGLSIGTDGYVIAASVVNVGTVAGGGGVTGITVTIGDGTGTITETSGTIFAGGQPQNMLPTNKATAGTLQAELAATGGNFEDMTGPDTGIDITLWYVE